MNNFFNEIDNVIQAAVDDLDRHDTFLDSELDSIELTDDEYERLDSEDQDSLYAAIDRALELE